MARPSIIPEILVLPLLQQWENGNNAEKCGVWLKENHNIEVSERQIARRIKELKDIQLQAKKDAVRNNASEKALDYISIMDQDIIKLNQKSNKLLLSDKKTDILLAKSIIETKRSLIMAQMNLTGMDQPEKVEQDQTVMVDRLLAKLGTSN